MSPSLSFTGSEVGAYSEEAFRSINQIDLVPTISILLGLPIPYANLGGAVPALLPPLYHRHMHTHAHAHTHTNRRTKEQSSGHVLRDVLEEEEEDTELLDLVEAPFAATVLALNAAQVWDYLTTYSSSANKLPVDALSDLGDILDQATQRLRSALSQSDGFDSIEYREACGLYKYFLSQATDLGKKVWTRFDTFGMANGIILLVLSIILFVPSLRVFASSSSSEPKSNNGRIMPPHPRSTSVMAKTLWKRKVVEGAELSIFLIFQCILLTFSNSYIVSEESIVMFMLSVLCITTTIFRYIATCTTMQYQYGMHTKSTSTTRTSTRTMNQMFRTALPLVVMFCSRSNNLLVQGHGLDPMIRKYVAHSPYFFLPSLVVLAVMRYKYSENGIPNVNMRQHRVMQFHLWSDITIILLLGISWIEKRSLDMSRHGYKSSRLSLIICVVGLIVSGAQMYHQRRSESMGMKKERQIHSTNKISLPRHHRGQGGSLYMTSITLLKVMLFIVTVTGPAAAASSILFLIQAWALTRLMFEENGFGKVCSSVFGFCVSFCFSYCTYYT